MKLIHVAFIFRPSQGKSILYLRKTSEQEYQWFEEKAVDPHQEAPLSIRAPTVEEALRLAHREYKNLAFRTLGCGFRYGLPERDEHGINALFHQMAASYSSPGGVYFDEDVSYNCVVHYSSIEALEMFKRLKEQNRI